MDIYNINQLLPLVEKKPEFVVLQKEGFQVIDYVYQDQHTFDDPMLMECRGIKFCPDGLILARPFRKFFNYGERGSGLPVHRPHVITEKLDGSMIHPTLLDRRLFFHTRKGHTDVALKAERYVLSTPGIDYQGFSYEAIMGGWTPIFEYTGPNNRIVIRYEKEALTLVAMRHMITGEIVSRNHLLSIAGRYNVPVVPVFEFDLTKDVLGFVQHARELIDAEGYVIYFDDGYMVKIKAQDYVLKHRALDDLGSKKKVVALCAQGFMDDVLPILSEADADELVQFNSALQGEVNTLAATAKGLVANVRARIMSRKTFALEWAPNIHPKWLAGVCFGIMDGKDARMLVLKAVERHYDDIGVKWRGE
jgi:RNA ligase